MKIYYLDLVLKETCRLCWLDFYNTSIFVPAFVVLFAPYLLRSLPFITSGIGLLIYFTVFYLYFYNLKWKILVHCRNDHNNNNVYATATRSTPHTGSDASAPARPDTAGQRLGEWKGKLHSHISYCRSSLCVRFSLTSCLWHTIKHSRHSIKR